MQITSREIASLAAAGAARFDMYTGIHKAMRAAMADTLLALGRMDADDEDELASVSQRVLGLLGLCESHLAHENTFVHPAIEARSPGACDAVVHEHAGHRQHIAALAGQVAALQCAPAPQRNAAALALYRALSLFVAENLQHMHVEETAHNAVLWARYTDAELVAIHDQLVASIPPEEMMTMARWLVPSMSPPERFHLVADMRAKAPAPALEAMLAVVRPHLTAREWEKLETALAQPA